MELACEESGLPVKTVIAFIRAGDSEKKEAVEWLNDFIEGILRELKDDFPKGISIDTFSKPNKLDHHDCDENRKQDLLLLAKEGLEKELTDFALKQEGGIESILKKLKKQIDERFDWALVDLADSYGLYHNWVKHYVGTEKGRLPEQTCMKGILDTLGGINELKKFDFNISGFIGGIVSKYEKMSPTVELSCELVSIKKDDDLKHYLITLKNFSVIPVIDPKLELEIEAKVYENGKVVKQKEKKVLPISFADTDKWSPWYIAPKNIDWVAKLVRLQVRSGYFYSFKLMILDSGQIACQIKIKATYREKFLKGEKEIILGEEIKSDNY